MRGTPKARKKIVAREDRARASSSRDARARSFVHATRVRDSTHASHVSARRILVARVAARAMRAPSARRA